MAGRYFLSVGSDRCGFIGVPATAGPFRRRLALLNACTDQEVNK